MQASILRLSNVIATPLLKEVNCWDLIAYDLCRQAISNGYISLKSPSNYKRDFIPDTVLLDALERLMHKSRQESTPEIYNISSGSSTTLGMLANTVATIYQKLYGKVVSMNLKPEADVVNNFSFSNDKLLTLGVDHNFNIDSHIRELLLFCRKNFSTDIFHA